VSKKPHKTYRKSGYAGSSSFQTDAGSSNRRTRHQGYPALAASPSILTTRENSLLHDDIPQRIPQRMILAIELETSRRLSRARELSYLLVSHLSPCHAKDPRFNPRKNQTAHTKTKQNKTMKRRCRNNIQRESDHGQQPRQSPRRAQTQGR
jgi:hypothetical protein